MAETELTRLLSQQKEEALDAAAAACDELIKLIRSGDHTRLKPARLSMERAIEKCQRYENRYGAALAGLTKHQDPANIIRVGKFADMERES